MPIYLKEKKRKKRKSIFIDRERKVPFFVLILEYQVFIFILRDSNYSVCSMITVQKIQKLQMLIH